MDMSFNIFILFFGPCFRKVVHIKLRQCLFSTFFMLGSRIAECNHGSRGHFLGFRVYNPEHTPEYIPAIIQCRVLPARLSQC